MTEINPDDEQARLAALKELNILDTLPEQELDDITLLASRICETPIAAISLIDEKRQWFKSRIGTDIRETPREQSFCHHAINRDDLFIVPDAQRDASFADNPLVQGEPRIRFYAGAPLVTSDGQKIGALCVIDQKPRRLSEAQQRALSALARSVISLIESKNTVNSQSGQGENFDHLFSINEEGVQKKSFFNRYVKYYLQATLIIVLITAGKMILDSVTQIETPYLLYAFAILLASWRGGLGAGLYATFAGVVTINQFFIHPYHNLFDHSFGQYLIFLIFIGQGVFISALCASRLKGEKLLYKAGKELENRINHRTRQLAQANNELRQEIEDRNVLQENLKQARDAALESARLKSEFLANMSHEIRTPMNGVIGMTGLLLETPLNAEQKRFAEIIRGSGESLLTIINDILDFSKVEAGKLEMETLDFNLREIIESLTEIFASRAREKNNELAALIYSDVPLNLRGDAGRIRQILTNLLGNAIKFTERGDVIVRVKNLHETAACVRLKFSVADTGEGISKDVQSKLFQPFTQSDASTTRRFGGTGLGLSICKKLIEMMGGEIGLESEHGKGATFWFTITLEKQPNAARKTAVTCETDQNVGEIAGKKVLIVDDNSINREVLLHQTRSWKMTASEAKSGEDALQILKKSPDFFDLLILDLQMPGIDGLETARRVLSQGETNRPPAMLMLSSSGFKINDDDLRACGITAFLSKPYRQDDLLNAVCRTLGMSREENAEVLSSDIHISSSDTSANFRVEQNQTKRILLVEDNSVNQMVAQNMLKNLGYRADVAANGREALQVLEIVPYDLILMDCQMPEMDGYEATSQIRSRDWNSAQTPVIALTAHATVGEREKCLRAGMDDYISKPINKETLRRVVANWIDSKSEKTNNRQATADKAFYLPETANQPIVSAVNFSVLNEVTDNDEEMRREVVKMYLSQTVAQLSEIGAAISARDAVKLYEVAHKTVGGSSICGMTAIVAPLRRLEQLGREGKTDEAHPFYDEAQCALAAITEECRQILNV